MLLHMCLMVLDIISRHTEQSPLYTKNCIIKAQRKKKEGRKIKQMIASSLADHYPTNNFNICLFVFFQINIFKSCSTQS